jgi:hypothetical protein
VLKLFCKLVLAAMPLGFSHDTLQFAGSLSIQVVQEASSTAWLLIELELVPNVAFLGFFTAVGVFWELTVTAAVCCSREFLVVVPSTLVLACRPAARRIHIVSFPEKLPVIVASTLVLACRPATGTAQMSVCTC